MLGLGAVLRWVRKTDRYKYKMKPKGLLTHLPLLLLQHPTLVYEALIRIKSLKRFSIF